MRENSRMTLELEGVLQFTCLISVIGRSLMGTGRRTPGKMDACNTLMEISMKDSSMILLDMVKV
jgi:hypothetical protein